MKTRTIYLTSTLLLAAGSQAAVEPAADELKLHYANPAGKAELTVKQDIRAGDRASGHKTTAGRKFNIDLDFTTSGKSVPVRINKANASYTAHGMTQRLPASKLNGQSLALSIMDGGSSLQRSKPVQDLEIPVGDIIGGDYPIGLALVDIMPVLPEDAVSVGTTWTTTQATRSLEGWAWASGTLSSQHRVTAIDNNHGHTIVSVRSTAKGQLSKAGKGLRYSGDGTLSRTSNWRFDATDGRLLTLSMEQETSGINTFPQKEVDVEQLTKIEFSITAGEISDSQSR